MFLLLDPLLLRYLLKYFSVREMVNLSQTCQYLHNRLRKLISIQKIQQCFKQDEIFVFGIIQCDNVEMWRLFRRDYPILNPDTMFYACIMYNAGKILEAEKFSRPPPDFIGVLNFLKVLPLSEDFRIPYFFDRLKQLGYVINSENIATAPYRVKRHFGMREGHSSYLNRILTGSNESHVNEIIYLLVDGNIPGQDLSINSYLEYYLREAYVRHPEFRSFLEKIPVHPSFSELFANKIYRILYNLSFSVNTKLISILTSVEGTGTQKIAIVDLFPSLKYHLYPISEISEFLTISSSEGIWNFLKMYEKIDVRSCYEHLISRYPQYFTSDFHSELITRACRGRMGNILDFLLSLNFGIYPCLYDLNLLLGRRYCCFYLDILIKHKVPQLREKLVALNHSLFYLFYYDLHTK